MGALIKVWDGHLRSESLIGVYGLYFWEGRALDNNDKLLILTVVKDKVVQHRHFDQRKEGKK